ncbi:MAG: ferritin family protein [candidate division Zixibacteria bacterium]|nr:ferritin family protein [candidate division Zixibacteria bacterium]
MNETKKEQQDPLEPLRVALKLEQEGKKFFLESATKFKSRLARRTFEFLAAEEDKHIKRIEEFYHSIESSGQTGLLKIEESTAHLRLAEFNDRLAELRDEIKPSASDVEAYQYALKFENGAEEFYEKFMNESDDPNIKRFYRWLIQEEEMHSKLIHSCMKFADDPAGWFKER